MNDQPENQQPTESLEDQIERLEVRKLQAETHLIEARMRRDRHRLVLDAVKWTVIAAAVVFAYIAAARLGWF
ncbi:MAG: hypothetical protein OXP09_22565 [Gammaproteobacteria bacterium]|nr:hypothetical protein [Gammaproteobacteria bacterium]